MSETGQQPTCACCGTPRLAGAPACGQCWAPFADNTPIPATGAEVELWSAAPVVAAGSPAELAHAEPNAVAVIERPEPTWDGGKPRLTAFQVSSGSRGRGRLIGVAAFIVVLLVAVGVFVLQRSGSGSTSHLDTSRAGAASTHAVLPVPDKVAVAQRLKEIRPGDGLPKGPPFSRGSQTLLDSPTAVATFMANLDPNVRKTNADIATLINAAPEWAQGGYTDEAFGRFAANVAIDLMKIDDIAAPASRRTVANALEQAVNDYTAVYSSLMAWMNEPTKQHMQAFDRAAAMANIHWDNALTAVYRGTNYTRPPHVHTVQN